MHDVKIEYAEPPHLIVFSIDGVTYTLKTEPSAMKLPHSLTQNNVPIATANVNNWIAQQTSGHYSLPILVAMAESFAAGKRDAYTLDDLIACGVMTFEVMRSKLFEDGLAGRYSEIFDIECLPTRKLDAAIHKTGQGETESRINRYIKVCLSANRQDLADAWTRILEHKNFGHIKYIRIETPDLDDPIRRSIEAAIRKRFRK